MYMINGSWDIVIVVLIVSVALPLPFLCSPLSLYTTYPHTHTSKISPYPNAILKKSQAIYWVETKNKTLEEVDAIFEGSKHSSVPDVETGRKGEVVVDTKGLEEEVLGLRERGKDSGEKDA